MTAHGEQSTPVTTAGDVGALVARLEGAYSTVFERSLARAAAAALRELSKDAERYRWLRSHLGDGRSVSIGHECTRWELTLAGAWRDNLGAAIDAAIDAALGGTEGP